MDVHTTNYTLCCYTIEADAAFARVQVAPDYHEILKYLERIRHTRGDGYRFVCGYEAGCLGYRLLSSWESTFTPYSGKSWDINTVRSAIDAFARRVSTVQPRHVRQTADTTVTVHDRIERILQYRPNPYMTAADFYYKLAAQYKANNNAIAYPVFDEMGELTAIYPINAQYFELLEYRGTMYCRFRFATGASYICEYSRLIHVRRHFLENDIFGDSNKPIETVLNTANTMNQSMGKFAELVAVIRGILKVKSAVKTEDLTQRRNDFIKDNLRVENNGSGVIVTDSKYDYEPIKDSTTPIPAEQLQYVKEEIYDFYGASKEIVENTASPDKESAFYTGEIAPFFAKLTQAFTNCLFTEREIGFGNRILFAADSIQFATLPQKVAAAKFLTDIGAATLDQILTMFDMPTIGGEEGARRVQTLNMVNAQLADKYQTGKETDPPAEPTEETPPEEEPQADGGKEE